MAKRKTSKEGPIQERIEGIRIESLMGSAFGEYAKSVIQDRAIPDARDGLKPVQRRIIYAMNEEGNTYDKPFRKSIKGVSAVMSNYHPHGDSSIYEAMMNLGKWWKNNLPFIDVQGNGGSIDGDKEAASRYVETRLSKNAALFVDDLPYKTVEMAPNFDDTKYEPTVLPARLPMCLVVGQTGIAAGYATDIPPFNLNEVVECTLYRLRHKRMNIDDVMQFIKGPDFPTGGYIIGKNDIRHCMETGKGKIVTSSSCTTEEGKKYNHIIFTDVPYEVVKQEAVKQVNQLNNDFIIECRDESDKEGIRVVVDIDKSVDVKTALNYILKNSNFQKNYNFNMVVIIDKKPVQAGVLQIIDSWIDFRKEVIVRRTRFLLDKYSARKEIVEGLIKANSILDKVIKVIRASKDRSDVIKNLMSNFKFSEPQAVAIADMRLHRLSNTDIVALKTELEDLTKKIGELKKILSSDNEVVKVIENELKQINKTYKTPRKTKIKETLRELEIDESKLVSDEDVFVIVTKDGYFKRLPLKKKDDAQFLKEDDEIIWQGKKNTLDYVTVYTTLGGYLKLQVHKIPECKPSDLGTHINKWVKCEGHKIVAAGEGRMIAWTSDGMIKIFNSDFEENTKVVKIPLYFKVKDAEVLSVEPLTKKYIFTATQKNLNFYPVAEIGETSLSSTGLAACKIKKDDVLIRIAQVDKDDVIKIGKNKFEMSKLTLTHRGYAGQRYKYIKS